MSRGTVHRVGRSEPGSCSAVTWVQSSPRFLRPSPRRPADRRDPRGQETSGSGTWHHLSLKDNGVERTCPPACFFPSFVPRILQVACEGVKHGSGKRVLSSHGNRIAGVKSTRRSIQRLQPARQAALKASTKQGCKRQPAGRSFQFGGEAQRPCPPPKRWGALEEGGRERRPLHFGSRLGGPGALGAAREPPFQGQGAGAVSPHPDSCPARGIHWLPPARLPSTTPVSLAPRPTLADLIRPCGSEGPGIKGAPAGRARREPRQRRAPPWPRSGATPTTTVSVRRPAAGVRGSGALPPSPSLGPRTAGRLTLIAFISPSPGAARMPTAGTRNVPRSQCL